MSVDNTGTGGSRVDVSTALAGLQKWAKLIPQRCREWGRAGSEQLVSGMRGELKSKARKGGQGGLYSGRLSKSIRWVMQETGNEINFAVGPNVPYARFVEGVDASGNPKPVARHFVPFSVSPDLRKWAQSKGIEVPARGGGLIVGGPGSESPFMRPAWGKHAPAIASRLSAIFRSV